MINIQGSLDSLTMNVEKFRKRKAISPILATVILIAITLIAAVAIAGFVFGLFGSFTSSAQVSVSVSTCTGTKSHLDCTFVARNTGSGSTSITGMTATYGATVSPATFTAQQVAAGGTATFSASFPVTGLTAGTMVTGGAALANGGTAQWSGTVNAVNSTT